MADINVRGAATFDAFAPSDELLRRISFVIAAFFGIAGLIMLIESFTTPIGLFSRAIEVFLSAGMLLAAWLLWRAAGNKSHTYIDVDLLPGEVALAAAFLYLGTALPAFYAGQGSRGQALLQFLTVLSCLVVGTGALVVSAATRGRRPFGRLALGSMIRDGVILLTGTVVLAISLSQATGPALHPPLWNWVSFLGITIPGMLTLVGREGVKQVTDAWDYGSAIQRWLRMLLVDALLVVGLTVMLYGSYTNLNLGVNGYTVRPKGNAAGFALYLAAALFLIGVRGAFKLASSQGSDLASYRLVSRLLYIVGVLALIYGERSWLNGKPPVIVLGSAAPGAILFLIGGLAVLILGGVAARAPRQSDAAAMQAH